MVKLYNCVCTCPEDSREFPLTTQAKPGLSKLQPFLFKYPSLKWLQYTDAFHRWCLSSFVSSSDEGKRHCCFKYAIMNLSLFGSFRCFNISDLATRPARSSVASRGPPSVGVDFNCVEANIRLMANICQGG